jgi:fumarate reductase flavoprotein subunit
LVNQKRRGVVIGAGVAVSLGAASRLAWGLAAGDKAAEDKEAFDLVIVGAGTAGLPAAIFAARRGRRVALIDAADDIGGTLHLANGQVSAAGSRTQQAKGIIDSPDRHYEDCMALSRGKADPAIIRLTVDEAPATINWLLDAGLTPLPDHPVTGDSPGRPAYKTPRYLWAKEEGPAILAVIRRELEQELPKGRIAVLLKGRVSELLTGRDGGVTGVRVASATGVRTILGRKVVLTSGGYAMNPAMFSELSGCPAYTATSWPQALGQGLTLATAVGGYLRGQDLHRAGTGSILTSETYPAKVYARVDTTPQRRLPWEIWVNDLGRRFVREDEPSTYLREQALVSQPALRYRIVFDDAILRASPPMIAGWSKEKLLSHFGTHPMFKVADSLEGLAAGCRIDPAALRDTVQRYNAAVERGGDEFGREHRPRRIETGPFYAITHLGHSATSSAGVVVDAALRVQRKDGSVVPNLYAVGEVLGSGATLGDAFVPGMMLTPALALGRWLGNTL